MINPGQDVAPRAPLEIEAAILAVLAGASVGALIVTVPFSVNALANGDAVTLMITVFFALPIAFVCWLAGIVIAFPVWFVMHHSDWTGRLHAFAAGVLTLAALSLLAFQTLGPSLIFGLLGGPVALTIQRVYYGKTAS